MSKEEKKDDAPVEEERTEEERFDNERPDSSADTDTPPKEDTSDTPKQTDPADALSRTPEELAEERAAQAAADTDLSGIDDELAEKPLPLFKRIVRKVNVYFLAFLLLLAVAGTIAGVMYFNSQKTPTEPDVTNQSLSSEALKQLANTDASVGNTSQTLTIQGNAVIAGQTLARGNINVAGNIQTGGNITTPNITISGTSNLGTAQINTLQVAQNVAIQGSTTMRDLNVAGTSSFGGAMTASQITVTRLILSGNATLEVPNHISFTGPTPSRSINASVLGGGGTASVSGSDTSGTVNIGSGNNPQPGCFVQLTFHQAFSRQPRVTVTPVGNAAGRLQFYVERTNSNFSICTANAAPANQTFAFDYFVAS